MKIYNTYLFGKSIDKGDWTPGELSELGARAAEKKESVRKVSREYILETLSRVGELFADRRSPYRKAALAHLSEHIPFSAPVTEKSLDILPGILDKQSMLKRMNMELFLPYAMEVPVERRGYDGLLRAVPKGVVLHVGAGNVFLGIIDSLIMGMLTKNVNIVKISSSGSCFAGIFLQALKAADKKGVLASSTAVLNWKGGRTDLEKAVLAHADAVLVWGGAEAVEAYRRIAPISARVEGFGPKTSMGIVFESALQNEGMSGVAEKAALDACLWDQSACSSLHTLYFLCPDRKLGERRMRDFLREAEKAFRRFQKKMPQGGLSFDEKTEVTRARQLAKADRALGSAEFVSSSPGTDWTVIWEKDSAYRVSPLNRVLYVKRAGSLEEIRERVAPFKGLLQTVGVAGSIVERKLVLETLCGSGVARVTRLGKMLDGANGSPHDGTFPMMALVNWIGIEGKPGPLDRLVELVAHARSKSPFYGRRFSGIGEITTLDDFHKVPFLEKRHVLENTPPESADLLTSKVQRGIYFASGGSTGQPKYVFYDQHEYEHTCRMLAFALEAGGLGRSDVIANLFVSGNLWSSWLSVEKAIADTKAISVPVGSALPLENIVKYLETFKVTAVIGLPSFMLKLAEFVEAGKGAYDLRINKIFYGGEYVGKEMAGYWQRVFPGAAVRSAGYATADAGVIGFQCGECSKGLHHLFALSQYIEFVDLKTLKPVPYGETGELVVTGLNKRHMPIIRYRVGDLGRWVDRVCACGRKEPLFEILGRCDDRIHVGGAHLFVNDVQSAVGKVPELGFNFQIVLDKKGHKDSLKIRVETRSRRAPAAAERKALENRLMREIGACCGDLKESIEMKWLDRPEIEFVAPGAIERVLRTGKIRRVRDNRIKA